MAGPKKKPNPPRSKKPKTGRGPFRGPTPKGVYQTVEIGPGQSRGLIAKAIKFPNRKYKAIERDKKASSELKNWKLRNLEVVTKEDIRELEQMAKKGIPVARHLSIDMPYGGTVSAANLFEQAAKVLLPNGKLYVTTEMAPDEWALQEAREKGFSYRKLPDIKVPKTPFQKYWQSIKVPIHRYEFTKRLKKAVPEKQKRRNWPR